MDVFTIIRNIPDDERLTEKPIPPAPQTAMVNGGTDEEWNEYWDARDNYYYGVQYKKGK